MNWFVVWFSCGLLMDLHLTKFFIWRFLVCKMYSLSSCICVVAIVHFCFAGFLVLLKLIEMRISHHPVWLGSSAHSGDLNYGVLLSYYEVSTFYIFVISITTLNFVMLRESYIFCVFISDSWFLFLSLNHCISVLPDECVWVLVRYPRCNFRNA